MCSYFNKHKQLRNQVRTLIFSEHELTKHIEEIEKKLIKMSSKLETNINLACLVPEFKRCLPFGLSLK